MKKNILIAGILSAISLAAISQASDNPWEYYWAGSSQKKSRSYSQSYNETTYGVGIKGLYAWASQDWEPDMGGVLADFYENISTESVIHQLSITSGYMKGSHDFGIQDTSRKVVPLLGGYTLHVPVCDSASLYFGAKYGIAWTWLDEKSKTSTAYREVKQSISMYTLNAGLVFNVSENAKIQIGYELIGMGSNCSPWHAIEAGFSWDF